MNLTPRKSETDPIVALLEDGGYETADQLAKAIVKSAFESLLNREWWLTVARVDDLSLVYGLSATQAQAERAELGGGFPRMVLPVTSAHGVLARVSALDGQVGTTTPGRG